MHVFVYRILCVPCVRCCCCRPIFILSIRIELSHLSQILRPLGAISPIADTHIAWRFAMCCLPGKKNDKYKQLNNAFGVNVGDAFAE